MKSPHMEKKVKLLKEYNKALLDENTSRDQQRQLLQSQINRLSSLEKHRDIRNRQQVKECRQCKLLRVDNARLEQHLQTLERDMYKMEKQIESLGIHDNIHKFYRENNQEIIKNIPSKPIETIQYYTPRNHAQPYQSNSIQVVLRENSQLRYQVQHKNQLFNKAQRDLHQFQLRREKRESQHFQEHQRLHKKIQELQKCLNSTSNNYQSLQIQNKQLISQINSLQQILGSYSGRISELSNELLIAKQTCSSTQQSVAQFSHQRQSLIHELNTIKNVNMRLKQDLNIYRQQNYDLHVRNKELYLRLSSLQSRKQNQWRFSTHIGHQNKATYNIMRNKNNSSNNIAKKQNEQPMRPVQNQLQNVRVRSWGDQDIQKDINNTNEFRLQNQSPHVAKTNYPIYESYQREVLQNNQSLKSLFRPLDKTTWKIPITTPNSPKYELQNIKMQIGTLKNENQHLKTKLYYQR